MKTEKISTLNSEVDELEDDETSQLYEHHRIVADKGQKLLRVDKFLLTQLSGTSRNRVQKAADAGFIMANGKPVKRSYKVKPDDVIQVMLDRPHYENKITPEDIPLDIVYEDGDLMVINKPAGLVVHPGFGNWKENKVQTAPSFRRTAASLRPHSQSSAESRERLGRAVLHGRDYISQHAVGRDAIGLSRGGGEATSRREGALRA